MYEILIGVIACYGAAAAAVHLARRKAAGRTPSESHFILLTRDDEPVIEHCLRSLEAHARKSGIPVRITVWDQGSQDGTGEIVRRWKGAILWVGPEMSRMRDEDEERRTAAAPHAGAGREEAEAQGDCQGQGREEAEAQGDCQGQGREAAETQGDCQGQGREAAEAQGKCKGQGRGTEEAFGGQLPAEEPEVEREHEPELEPGQKGRPGSERGSEEGGAADIGWPNPEQDEEPGSHAAASPGAPARGCKEDSNPRSGREQILWSLRAWGIVSERDQPILIDMKNVEDWSKLPF
ncbi:hypothetical protein HGI30_21165 [Paenibacillus albicereus]|uniref:Uncharacterized protein n=1 Tax=Paenibacillus albicereus TaxID=2726185 RepID=A0A6H2H2B7_9BACL|nr:hypothetical protein [Paenibacillus albicereus]QJC53785.1 hypothetical protein HGI30_21165 [Paenibacillus albicereus]